MDKKIKRERSSTTKTEIINLLTQTKKALSHKDFQEFFENNIDRVTIYRALDRLVLEGKLHKIANFDGVIHYALCAGCDLDSDRKTATPYEHKHEHVHFSCVVCHETTCIEQVVPKIDMPSTYKVLEAQILVNGICEKCNK